MKPEKPTQRDVNQGEGDRVSARHYNEQLRDFVGRGKVEPAARKAEAFVEQMPEAAARAERQAKRGPTARAGVIGKARDLAEQARPMVEHMIGKLRARLNRK